MSHRTSSVYVSGRFSEPMTAQHNFNTQYDTDNPNRAMSSYNRIMHEHTKRQLNMATNSARRRSSGTSPGSSESSLSSISSTSS
ncbi:uncharacterized protein BDR25DRAFT_308161 [Lindgomyces ingoldianus]|uniref:Uncharacterized protein n=1 Tax=Lindgomyces ingoldianus TaxID=673940 RepID=A0ACB6Q880_9PLEO|nr:uncharacterized protein BDR25DRAFT_308161 [Lindgomyces ingoldianus]KAF2462788.1 hypothetical protein BDR25DRAFT_308161 [Lindgomyces ingoldianus]